jgi:hypothetical protein
MREQQRELSEQRRAEVWPYLQFGKGHDGEIFRFVIANEGIGPARIQSIHMNFDAQPVKNWFELLVAVHPKAIYSYTQSHVGGRVIRAGDAIEALLVRGELGDSLQMKVATRLRATICYCSVYNECWNYMEDFAGGAYREPADACEAHPDEFEQ